MIYNGQKCDTVEPVDVGVSVSESQQKCTTLRHSTEECILREGNADV
jgi:hypothetical protein